MIKKYAVCSVVNKKYIDYLKVFAFSLIKHNPGFDRDYIVFFKKGDLGEEEFAELKKIYDGFVFHEVVTENYSHINPGNKLDTESKHCRELFEWTYYRLEMFNLRGYEQVIWFDIDMLVMGNLNELFDVRFDDGILACEDLLAKSIKSKEEYERDHKIQGGLIVVGKNMMNRTVYNDLLSLLGEAYRFNLNDQSMFVEYFGNTGRLKALNSRYNLGRKVFLLIVQDLLLKNLIDFHASNTIFIQTLGSKNSVHIRPLKFDGLSQVIPSIIHYAGSKKPTSLDCECPTFQYWHHWKQALDFFLSGAVIEEPKDNKGWRFIDEQKRA